MSFVAIMAVTPEGRLAKRADFPTEAEALVHVAAHTVRYPDAFVVATPVEPESHWLLNMSARPQTLTIVPPPTPEPTATGAQMIDEAEERGKLNILTNALTPAQMAMFVTRRRIVAGSNFAEVLRAKMSIGAGAMKNFIAAAAERTEV